MKETWDIYRLVRFVDSEEYKKSRIHKIKKDRVVKNLEDLYVAKTGKSPHRVKGIASSAYRESPQYLEEYLENNIHLFRTTKEGRTLTEWWIWGLFKALLKENWLAITAILTIIGSIVKDIVPRLIDFILN